MHRVGLMTGSTVAATAGLPARQKQRCGCRQGHGHMHAVAGGCGGGAASRITWPLNGTLGHGAGLAYSRVACRRILADGHAKVVVLEHKEGCKALLSGLQWIPGIRTGGKWGQGDRCTYRKRTSSAFQPGCSRMQAALYPAVSTQRARHSEATPRLLRPSPLRIRSGKESSWWLVATARSRVGKVWRQTCPHPRPGRQAAP